MIKLDPNLQEVKDQTPDQINNIRAEISDTLDYQIAYINLNNETDPSAILTKDDEYLTIISDKHSYSGRDRIFPINQDENTVFAQYVYQDSKHHQYNSVLDMAAGSGVIAMAAAKAGDKEVLAADINSRAPEFIYANNGLNNLHVKFVQTNLFDKLSSKTFDKITMNPPFMPAPDGTFPLHAQGGAFGVENVVTPFFQQCWNYLNPGGKVQGIFHSFANDSFDTVLSIIDKNLPKGWSYEIKHVFPIKDMPIDLYLSGFAEQENYQKWIKNIRKVGLDRMRFFMITINNDGRVGLQKESMSEPRLYNLIYPSTTLHYLSKSKIKPRLLKKPLSETNFASIGHLIRLSRYNYYIYLTLCSLFD